MRKLESPVLWIRVDPDFEFIRKAEVRQEENHWHYQLLKERDFVG